MHQPTPTRRLVRAGLVVPLLVLVAACGNGGSDSGTANSTGLSAHQEASTNGGRAGAAVAGQPIARLVVDSRKLIRTATLEVAVKDVSKAVSIAEQKTAKAGGAVYDEKVDHDSKGASAATLTLKIPPTQYGDVLDSLASDLGSEVSRTQNVKDVTEDVVDVNSRLDAQSRAITRIKGYLDTATKISDIVEIETDLSKREADYESLLARQRALAAQTDLATIELTITRADNSILAATLEPKSKQDKGFFVGLKAGWSAFVTFGTGLLTALGALLPFLVVGGVVAAAVVAVVRRRKPSAATGLVD